MACVKDIPIPFSGLGSIGKEVTFHTGPLDLMGTGAGDRNPYLEMEITWTPEGAMRKKKKVNAGDGSWNSMVEFHDGIPWNSMNFHRVSWISMGFHGCSDVDVEFGLFVPAALQYILCRKLLFYLSCPVAQAWEFWQLPPIHFCFLSRMMQPYISWRRWTLGSS